MYTLLIIDNSYEFFNYLSNYISQNEKTVQVIAMLDNKIKDKFGLIRFLKSRFKNIPFNNIIFL